MSSDSKAEEVFLYRCDMSRDTPVDYDRLVSWLDFGEQERQREYIRAEGRFLFDSASDHRQLLYDHGDKDGDWAFRSFRLSGGAMMSLAEEIRLGEDKIAVRRSALAPALSWVEET